MQKSNCYCKEANMGKWLGPAVKDFGTTERLSDCRFIIEDADGSKQIFECHKFIFCCGSKVFERMFFGDFLESKSNEVYLSNVRPLIFAKFREYLYNYDTKLFKECDEETLTDLLQFGQQYLVSSVTEECIKILCQRIQQADIVKLIHLYQLANDILHEDSIKNVWERITSTFPKYMNHYAIYKLSSDAFFKYLEMSKDILKETLRFYMIETYLILNGFDITKDISKPNDCFDEDDLKTTEANEEEDKDLEHRDQGDDNELEDDNKTEAKSNISNQDNKETMQTVKFKNSYIKNLLELIDYKKMTPHEFYNGPGKSKFLDLQEKYDMLYATISA